jgi:peptidoglycan pentaglycine glycine transferase (the first glycine)
MQVERLAANVREEWNAFVRRQPSFGLLQSWEWGEFKKALGWKPFRIAVRQNGSLVAGAQVLVRCPVPGLPGIAYMPRGPIGTWLDPEIAGRLLAELHQLASSQGAAFLRIEPPLLSEPGLDERLRQHGFKPSRYTNQPRATIILNLTPSLDDIMKQLRKTTRKYVRYSARHGVSVRQGTREDLAAFHNLMRITARRAGFSPRTRHYYEQEWAILASRQQAVLLMASFQGRLLAAQMVSRFGDHAASLHGGSSGCDAGLHPNHLLVWEGIKWAKEWGCRTYDLWGIPDEVGQCVSEGCEPPVSERTDGLWGVYRFKIGFGKNVVYYAGAYDYIYTPVVYGLIANRFINTDVIDRAAAWLDRLWQPGGRSACSSIGSR